MSRKSRDKHALMLCHDQDLDRRIVAQARSLSENGVFVTIVGISHDTDGSEEEISNKIVFRRIGLSEIVPENEIYLSFNRRQKALNGILNWSCNKAPRMSSPVRRIFNIATHLNGAFYRFSLFAKYRNLQLADPLPFRSAFLSNVPDLEFEIIQVHDLPALSAGVEIAAQRNVPLVYDAHELYPEQKAFSSVQKRICSQAEDKLIKRADLVFAVNQSIAEEMSARYGISAPTVLLNAIDPHEAFDRKRKYDLLRKKTGVDKKSKILLFQGGFSPNRNLEALVSAFRCVRSDVSLVMMGFGAHGNTLKTLAERQGTLGQRVYFLSAVPQDELLQHSASADMGIIPYPHSDLNSYYCTPNKLFEFIQAELPILANQSPELERFVSSRGFGICHPMHSERDISDAINKAFDHDGFTDWKAALRAGRAELTWAAESRVYLGKILPLINRGEVQ